MTGVARAMAAVAAGPAAALAHPDGTVLPGELFGTWTLDPWILAGVFLPAWLYFRGARRLWRRAGPGRGVRRWQAWCFGTGVVALFLALVSPLDALGGTLFSAHMLQHMVLMLVAAPLMVLGAPAIAFAWALPRTWLTPLGRVVRNPDVRGIWYVFRHPVAAWSVHAMAIWVWHVPVLYEATLRSELVHLAQHGAFFGTAILFWWAALDFGRRQRLRYGFGTLYVFTTAMHSGILGALLTFSGTLWYPIYADRTAAWGLSPLEDQQLGGLLMWIPAGVVYLSAALVLLAVALGAEGREDARRAAPVLAALWLIVLLPGCEGGARVDGTALQVSGGDAALGPEVMRRYGCIACHTIPGVRGATAWVGPPLTEWSRRVYISGLVPNTPDNLVRWIQDPQQIHPGTVMPTTGITADEARHVAAYLFTLR